MAIKILCEPHYPALRKPHRRGGRNMQSRSEALLSERYHRLPIVGNNLKQFLQANVKGVEHSAGNCWEKKINSANVPQLCGPAEQKKTLSRSRGNILKEGRLGQVGYTTQEYPRRGSAIRCMDMNTGIED